MFMASFFNLTPALSKGEGEAKIFAKIIFHGYTTSPLAPLPWERGEAKIGVCPCYTLRTRDWK